MLKIKSMFPPVAIDNVPDWLGRFSEREDLVWFDGALLTHFVSIQEYDGKSYRSDFIRLWVECDYTEKVERYLFISTTPEAVNEFKDGNLSTKGLVDASDANIFLVFDVGYYEETATISVINKLPEAYFNPTHGR